MRHFRIYFECFNLVSRLNLIRRVDASSSSHSSLGMGLAFVPSTGYVVGIFLIGKTVRVNTVHFTDRSKKYVTSTVTLVMPSPSMYISVLAF
jgi:hypothetical protein